MKKLLMFICVFVFMAVSSVPCYADSNIEVSLSDESMEQTDLEEISSSEATSSEVSESLSEFEQTTADVYEDTGLAYASGEELENMYAAFMNNEDFYFRENKLSLVKESISPVYIVELEHLVRKKELILTPEYSTTRGRMYYGKLVFENGEFAGTVMLFWGNGKMTISGWTDLLSNPDKAIEASPSYADHAERIRRILGADKVIPPTDVRFVSIPYLGKYFYIYNQDYQVFVPVGVVNKGGGNTPQQGRQVVLNLSDIEEYAARYVKRLDDIRREAELWEKEHPGRAYLPLGGGMNIDAGEYSTGLVSINNITDIASYLNIDYSQNWDSTVSLGADLKPIKEKSSAFLPLLFVGIGALLASGAVVFLILYKRRKSVQNAEH